MPLFLGKIHFWIKYCVLPLYTDTDLTVCVNFIMVSYL